jgi:hypothetical protein
MLGRVTRALFVTTLALTLLAPPALVQGQATAPAFRVQLHVAADESIRPAALAALRAALQPVRDIELSERDAEYILSVVVFRTAADGFAASLVMMSVHTRPSLEELARLWRLDAATRMRLVTLFNGTGALLDQRMLNGADLATLSGDLARAVDVDILAAQRQFRRALLP